MSTAFTVISQYPLSRPYGQALATKLDAKLEFLTLGDLRRNGLAAMLVTLRKLRGTAVIALEDPTSAGTMPIMRLVGAMSGCRDVLIADHELSTTPIGRWEQLYGLAAFLGASVRNRISVGSAVRDLKKLLTSPRLDACIGAGSRVAYLNTNLWFGQKAGGSVGHISGVANGFMEHGYALDYLTVGGRLQIKPDARHFELDPPQIFGLPMEANYFQFDRDFERQASAVIEPSETAFLYQRLSIGNYTGVRLARRFGIPLVVEYNGSEDWDANNWGGGLRFEKAAQMAETVTLRHAQTIVTISDVLRDELIGRGIEPHRIACYPNCIDPEVFDPARFDLAELQRVRAALDVPGDACVATFLGTFGAWHGAEVFAEAIRKLAETQAETLRQLRMMFLFIGDGMRHAAVRSILSGPECAPFVRFAGLVPQADAPAYLAASDILVSPHVPNSDGSRFFGSPTKLFEYMGMAKPIVASDLDQIGEVLANSIRGANPESAEAVRQSGKLAMLLPPGDAGAIADALVTLAADAPLRAALGSNARAEALAKYTWRRHVQEILDTVRRR